MTPYSIVVSTPGANETEHDCNTPAEARRLVAESLRSLRSIGWGARVIVPGIAWEITARLTGTVHRVWINVETWDCADCGLRQDGIPYHYGGKVCGLCAA